jgi:decaprenylphospho-beta-D-ribofuranose 2-oxidase
MMMKSGWGNYPKIKSKVLKIESLQELQLVVRENDKILAFGNNLSYGDSSLSTVSIDMKKLNGILSFDSQEGILKVEAGTSLKKVLELIVPFGWFVLVTPGTKYVTVGGMIASNVHGKNHHKKGSFGNSVISMDMVLADGKLISCSRDQKEDLFWVTLGGQGLTGAIYSVDIKLERMRSSYLEVYNKKCANIESIFHFLEMYDDKFPYSVAWLDIGRKRGIVMLGKPKGKNLFVSLKKPFKIKTYLPNFVINYFTLSLFTFFYYHFSFKGRKKVHYEKYFYPLDIILDWNKAYGKRGFIQYQCVFPLNEAKIGVKEILSIVKKYKKTSALSVLKKFKEEHGVLSFPIEGYTLTMDFPVDKNTLKMAKELDKIVIKRKGRIYLTKDAIMSKETFEQMYPVETFKKIKQKYDPKNKFTSKQAQRIGI